MYKQTQFYLNLSDCTFSKLCAALALCLQTKWLWNPRISKLSPLLHMLENCFSISEVSYPKNSTDNISRIPIRILLILSVRRIRENSAVSGFSVQNFAQIVDRFETIKAIIYSSDQQMSWGWCNFSSSKLNLPLSTVHPTSVYVIWGWSQTP